MDQPLDILRYHDRDIVVIDVPGEGRTAFYRSTGRNSREPGRWFPFNGVRREYWSSEWFDKRYFVKSAYEDRAHPLHRYGFEWAREIGERLGAQDVPPGREAVSAAEVNLWICTKQSLENLATLNDVEQQLTQIVPTLPASAYYLAVEAERAASGEGQQ